MAVVNQVEKKAKMDKFSIVQYQIVTHCFLSGIVLSSAELSCLSMLALEGEQELNSFCQKMFGNSIFKSPQTVRNTSSTTGEGVNTGAFITNYNTTYHSSSGNSSSST